MKKLLSITGLAALSTLNAKALIYYVLTLVIVAGIIVGSVWYVAHVQLADVPVVRQAVAAGGPTGGVIQDQIGYIIALTGWELAYAGLVGALVQETIAPEGMNAQDAANAAETDNSLSRTNSFSLFYGLGVEFTNGSTLNVRPWIVTGGTTPAGVGSNTMTQGGVIQNVQVNPSLTSTSCVFTVAIDGTTFIYYTPDLNGLDSNNDYTNTFDPQTVVIQRTTDFVNWTPIFTNGIGLNTIESFTDTNPPASNGFYRACYLNTQ